jgi:hypothetical protein
MKKPVSGRSPRSGGHRVKSVTMNIERQYFAAILAVPPRKTVEYRKMSDYWKARLAKVGSAPFRLRLINGMTHPIPEAEVEVIRLVQKTSTRRYELHLGRVFSVKNWDRVKEIPVDPET